MLVNFAEAGDPFVTNQESFNVFKHNYRNKEHSSKLISIHSKDLRVFSIQILSAQINFKSKTVFRIQIPVFKNHKSFDKKGKYLQFRF